MSAITHDVVINAMPKTVYQAITTTEGLKSWFTTQVEGSGKVGTNWDLSFTAQLFFRWHILTANAPTQVVWQCLVGPGNAPGTKVEFHINSTGNEQTTLTISHRGWIPNDPKFTRCVEIWRSLMTHLTRYCETGVSEPTYQ